MNYSSIFKHIVCPNMIETPLQFLPLTKHMKQKTKCLVPQQDSLVLIYFFSQKRVFSAEISKSPFYVIFVYIFLTDTIYYFFKNNTFQKNMEGVTLK